VFLELAVITPRIPALSFFYKALHGFSRRDQEWEKAHPPVTLPELSRRGRGRSEQEVFSVSW
ncbi:MAG: hypothetical protein WCG66_12945, partial [bacterium]